MKEDEFWRLTPVELYVLQMEWKKRINLRAMPTAFLASIVLNYLKTQDAEVVSPEKLLPFPPPRRYMSALETEGYLDRLLGTKAPEEKNGD